MLDEREHKNVQICDESDYSYKEEHECIMTLTLCLIPLKKSRDKIYIWISEPTNGTKYIVEVTILFICQRMCGRRVLFREKGRLIKGKNILQRKLRKIFCEVCNQRGDMVELFWRAGCLLSFRHTLWTTCFWIHNWVYTWAKICELVHC